MISENFYKQALLIRRTEDTFINLFEKGKMNGTVHTCNGQEFSAIAFCHFLEKKDTIFSNHRCHGHYIARTNDVEGLIKELMGKESGVCGGIGSSQHLCNDNFYSNGIQGGNVPVAAGLAMSSKLKGNRAISVVFIGDGTLGEGAVYESFNIAALYKLPLLIICENNGYAQSTAQKNNLSGSITARAEAFGIKTFHSNTWDLEVLFKNAEASINYVRENCLPVFHLVDTYRLNPHSKGDDDRDKGEIIDYFEKDPLNLFQKLNESAYSKMLEDVDQRVNAVVAIAEYEEEQPGVNYYKPGSFNEVSAKLDYLPLEIFSDRLATRINQFFDKTMQTDKTVIFIGEDVLSPYGGAFKVSRNLSEKYPDNVITTPISELAITGLCNGLALGGFKPYLEIMFGDFITLAIDQIINHASKYHHMYNKKVTCPIVIRTPMGGGRGYGPTHSQTLDKLIAGIDNVKLIALNSFLDPQIIYNQIYQNEIHPVIVSENKIDYGRIVGDKKQENYTVYRSVSHYPIVICSPNFSEPTLTIVSYGGIASEVFEKLNEIFIETEFLPELIVLSQLSPLDITPIIDSVKKSRNLIIIEEGGKDFGIGSEILSSVVEHYDAPELEIKRRIGAYPVPIPSARSMEEYTLPNKKILNEIIKVLNQ
jgi:2-oxoisovalerate dehydrogenase E1 component